MNTYILVILWMVLSIFGNQLHETESPRLIQNKPAEVGTEVTFTIVNDNSTSEPIVAWDFGDNNGLGSYIKGATAKHTFSEPGVYYVFARIQGEDIPLSVIQMIIKPIQNPAPAHSTTICMDHLTQKLWVVNPDNNSVTLIDAVNNEMVKEVPIGNHPRTVALDKQSNAWVTNEDDATISVISSEGKTIETIKLPYASRPYGVCLDPLKNYAYVSLQGTGQLLQIDAATKEILHSVDVGRSPRGIAVTSDGSKVLVTQFISPEDKGLVREVDTETMSLNKVIELAYDNTPDFEDRGRGVPNYLSSITISPDGKEAWVPSKKDNTARGLFRDGQTLTFDNTVRTIVSKINLSTGEENISGRLDINDADMACAIEFSPYGNMAFVALQGNNRVVMVDVEYHSKLGSLDTTGLAPQGMVLNADGTRLYVHNFMSRSVRVIDVEDILLANNQVGTVVATIPTVVKEKLPEQVLKGKQIFYNAQDERMTFAGYISCASCHLDGGSDERVWDFTDRGEGLRNTHSILGRRGTAMGNVHWTGNFDEIQDFENDMRNSFGGKGFLPDSIYNALTNSDPLGSPKKGLSPELDALTAYIISLDKVHPSPFRDENGELTPEAVKGKMIFSKAGCGDCHGGSDFTDRPTGVFHNVGTIQPSSGKRRNSDLSGFATPTLKGIWESAPYLHDGSAATLKDVLVTRNFNKQHGDLSNFTEEEIDQLVSYLNQIDESESIDNATSLSQTAVHGSSALMIYPNPATEIVKILIPDTGNEYGILNLYHVAGSSPLQTIKTFGGEVVTLDLTNLPQGVYHLNFKSKSLEKSSKLVIK